MNQIIINEDTYDNETVYSGNIIMVESMTGDELQYDTFEVEVETTEFRPTLYIPKNSTGYMTTDNKLFGVRPYIHMKVKNPEVYTYGTPVIYRHNGELVGKFYMSNLQQSGKTQYIINCVSAIGLLSNTKHYGGIYFGVKVSVLAAEIIGGAISYTIDPALANQLIYGWLPIATRRENLHQLLFAMSASAKKDANGDLYITSASSEIVKEIDSYRIYIGGSIDFLNPITRIALSEHAYIERSDDEEVTLFDGLVSADTITTPLGEVVTGGVVLFDDPMHDLVPTGTTIIESGVNYAVLSPSAECTLTGKKYTHTVRQVTRPEIETDVAPDNENSITITNATLVSVANSEIIANRLFEYYSSTRKISVDIVSETEHPGDTVQFKDPFGNISKGIIEEMSVTMSGILKAQTSVIAGYEPPDPGNYYNNVIVITESGTWTPPEGVERARVVLIAGGQGGSSGEKGENGDRGKGTFEGESGGAAGDGGAPGSGGAPGKIYIVTTDIEANVGIEIQIGVGGAGGICTEEGSGAGQEGSDTTFGQYSSALGSISSVGYAEIFTGDIYATKGIAGLYSGARGGDGSSEGEGKSSDPGYNGESITYNGTVYEGGKHGTGATVSGNPTRHYLPGGGGGAAVAAIGEDGDNRGYGGKGADATIPGNNATIPGSGGQGGNGGGGGGGGGLVFGNRVVSHHRDGADGGLGSPGGRGANGCVIIYY